ncbi:MAG TPA: glycosyltransferase family 4 protein [Dokdonella sp.]|nr:glycosyltransferase family 4 protein [Dokdonella sp.]
MSLLGEPSWAMACVAALFVSALLTHAGIRYGRSRKLIDEPGRRRSHVVPTPRGGGIGIVVAVLGCAMLPAVLEGFGGERLVAVLITLAILVVAAVGWIDDHRGLGRWVRFFAQWIAGFLVLAGYEQWPAWLDIDGYWLQAGIVLLFGILGVVWSINLHNFMDGIDGLLAAQAVFVFVAGALLMSAPYPWLADEECILVVAAFAVLGFLPFNFPRARIFMGDVGSGTLGLLVAVAVIWLLQRPDIALGTGLVLCSGFVTDATATLVLRVVRGRRWYSPHREHLYQWLVRSGWSHAQVVTAYMGWNTCIVVPVVWWMNRDPAAAIDGVGPSARVFVRDWVSDIAAAVPLVAGVHALALLVWMLGKRQ